MSAGGAADHRRHRAHRAVAHRGVPVARRSSTRRSRRAAPRSSSTPSRPSGPLPTDLDLAGDRGRHRRHPGERALPGRPARRGDPASSTSRPGRCSPAARARDRRLSGPGCGLEGVRGRARRRAEVLHGIDLAVARGELLVVLGPSGAGKSTLLRVVAGLEPATARPGAASPGGTSPAAPGPAQRVDGVPVVRAVPAPHRRREHRLRAGGARHARRAAAPRAAPRPPPTRSAARTCSTAGPASSPAASGSAWRWPGRWSASRTSSCSTSRCPTWTLELRVRDPRPSCRALHDRVGATTRARHPRPDRGAGARRPDRRAARRPRRAGRHAGGDLARAGDHVRRPVRRLARR